MNSDPEQFNQEADFNFSSFLAALSGESLPTDTYRAPGKQEATRLLIEEKDKLPVQEPRKPRQIPRSAKTNRLSTEEADNVLREKPRQYKEKGADTASLEEGKKKPSREAGRIALSHIPVKVQFTLEQLLETMIREKASDLNISAGSVPSLRIDGEINQLQLPDVDAGYAEELLLPILTDEQRDVFEEEGDLDFSIDYMDKARFRVNFFHHYKGIGGIFRNIPLHIPELVQLGLPPVIKNLLRFKKGLLIIAGPTGQGKTTTMASMINEINRTRKKRIITLENPIEYVFSNQQCLISQREIGSNALSYSNALWSILREDPDIIMVSELWEPEEIRQALEISETGHLVLTTMKTFNCTNAVERLVDTFPQDEQEQIRVMVSETLIGVIAQHLIPRADGRGRALASEILLATTGLATLIREGKFNQINSIIQTGRELGMQTLDHSLLELVQAGIITSKSAKNLASDDRFFRRAGIRFDE